MFDKDNFLNSITYLVDGILKDKLTLDNSTITVQRTALNISSINNPNTFYIILAFPRSTKLPYMYERYGSEKLRKFRVDMFVVAQNSQSAYKLAGKLTSFVDTNEHLFTAIGLGKPAIVDDFVPVEETSLYNSTTVNGSMYAVVGTLEGEISI